jgi:hypothetical protein
MTDTWQDIPTSDRPKGHPSSWERECEQLRAENEALRTGDWSQVRLVRFEDGQFDFSAGPVRYIAEYFAQMFEAGGGKYFNNMEIEFGHPKAGPMILSAQRRAGKTPVQQRKDAEAEAKQLRERVAELEAALREIERDAANGIAWVPDACGMCANNLEEARAALQTGLQCDEGTTGGNGSWNSRQATQGQYRGRE